MPIAKDTKSFDPAPAGTHVARCYGCVSLGTQHSPMFADAFKVMLMFELPHERITNGQEEKPMTVTAEYTLSLNKKSNLRKHLDAWRGKPFTEEELKGFDVNKVVGAPCQVTISHGKSQTSGNVYAKIESITGLAKGMACPPQEHQSIKYEIEQRRNDVYKALPEWIRKKIDASEELTPTQPIAAAESAPESAPEDDLPEDDQVPF